MPHKTKTFELPEELKPKFKKAKKIEWITIGYLLTVIILMYLVMGSSQAMKTAWLEDALSIVPAISFLVASRIYNNSPSKKYPYGFHRAYSIAFLTGSLALFAMGVFLIYDSSMSLIMSEHPTIGSMEIFGNQVWMGWIMMVVLLYSSIPAMILGKMKLPLAKQLHNKILFTDAEAQKADYMTALAAILGLFGVGIGLWWADATAALFISFSVLKDGYKNLKHAIEDLMEREPMLITEEKIDPLKEKMEQHVLSWPWVKDARIRLREHGQVYFGEILLQPKNDEHLITKINNAREELYQLDWKIHDLTIMPLSEEEMEKLKNEESE